MNVQFECCCTELAALLNLKLDGAAWLSMVRRGSLWCGVAHYGAAWLIMVRRGSLWCGVAQLVARWLAGRQARVRFSARHHREVCPTELSSDEEKKEASANVLYECDWMIVCML